MEAVMPITTWIFAPEFMTVGTKALGYPDYFAYSLVIAKILGVIAIALPKIPQKLKEWAYAGLTFNLIFAFISHSCVDKHWLYDYAIGFFRNSFGIIYLSPKNSKQNYLAKASLTLFWNYFHI